MNRNNSKTKTGRFPELRFYTPFPKPDPFTGDRKLDNVRLKKDSSSSSSTEERSSSSPQDTAALPDGVWHARIDGKMVPVPVVEEDAPPSNGAAAAASSVPRPRNVKKFKKNWPKNGKSKRDKVRLVPADPKRPRDTAPCAPDRDVWYMVPVVDGPPMSLREMFGPQKREAPNVDTTGVKRTLPDNTEGDEFQVVFGDEKEPLAKRLKGV